MHSSELDKRYFKLVLHVPNAFTCLHKEPNFHLSLIRPQLLINVANASLHLIRKEMASSERVPKDGPSGRPQLPKYTVMVEEAVKSMNERGGSSRQAIQKYVKANYPVNENSDSRVKSALKKCVEKERLVQTKGKGASGSFKLSRVVKEEAKQVEKKEKKKLEKQAAKEKENNPLSSSDSEQESAEEKEKAKKTKKSSAKASKDKDKEDDSKKPRTVKAKKGKESADEKPKKARQSKKVESEGSATKQSKTKSKKPAAKETEGKKKSVKKSSPSKSKASEAASSKSKPKKTAEGKPKVRKLRPKNSV